MNNRILLGLLVGLCTLSACNHIDEKIIIDDGKPTDGERCVSAEFKAQCRTEVSYIVCENDVIATKSCGDNQACLNGECKNLADPNGGNQTCTDVGCLCSSASFKNTCDGSISTSCVFGQVMQYDCAVDGLNCVNGECVVPDGKKCDSSFKSKCIGNKFLFCDEAHEAHYQDEVPDTSKYLYLVDCGPNICTTMNDLTSCYRPCSVEGEKSCYSDYYDEAYLTSCQKGKDGLFFALDDTECLACFASAPGSQIERVYYDEGTICAKKHCSDSEEDRCDGNKVVSCQDEYLVEYDCGDHTCVVDDDRALCAEECTAKQLDSHKLTCGIEHSDKVGFFFNSKDFVCRRIGDKYYWMLDDELECEHGCDDTTGGCIKTHPDEGKKCDSYDNKFEARCDGNLRVYCDGEHVSVKDCGDDTCLKYKGRYTCAELCTPEDLAGNGHVCMWETESVSFDCDEAEHGKFVKNFDSNSRIDCQFGCDEKTGECVVVDDREGTPCDPDIDDAVCANDDVVLHCAYVEENDKMMYKYVAESCNSYYGEAKNRVCVQPKGISARCEDACKASDVDNKQSSCHDSYFTSRECINDGNVYYWNDVGMSCEHGCDDATGKCKVIHTDEGKSCDPEVSPRAYCDGDIMLECRYGKSLIATDCSKEPVQEVPWSSENMKGTCGSWMEGDDERVMCMQACTAEDATKNMLECDYDRVIGWECINSGNTYFWKEKNEYCYHGCDEETKACITIHDDEGKVCSGNDKCANDHILLTCDGVYQATDCREIRSECVSDSNGARCSNECTEEEYTAGAKKTICQDDEMLVYYHCVDGYEYVHEWHDFDVNYCAHGCNSETNECITIHKDEGKPCHFEEYYDEEKNEFVDGDAAYCDGKYFLTCVMNEFADPEFGGTWMATQCDSECHPALYGCYESCTTVGETVSCKDGNIVTERCVEDSNLGIKYKTTDTNYCSHGCDSEKLECIKIHAKEGESCSRYEEDDNYFVDKCEDDMYLQCIFDSVVAFDCSGRSCDERIGCYYACSEVNEEVTKCQEIDGKQYSITGYCINYVDEYLDINIKLLDYYDDECPYGCDSSTGKCKPKSGPDVPDYDDWLEQ